MLKTYYNYRIRINNYEIVEVEKSDIQNDFQGKLEGKFSLKVNQEKLGEIAESLMTNSITDQRLTRTLGELLFYSIFDSTLCHDFLTVYDQVVRQNQNLLRIELDVDEKRIPVVAALPWEFLCLPEKLNKGTIWFATHPNLVFSRRRQLWQPARPIQLKAGEKLKIGLAVASPQDLPRIIYQPVQEELEKLAKEQPDRIEILPIVEQANPSKINQFLEKNQPHIFHFIGHGRFLPDQHSQIALTNLVNKCQWVDAEDFADYLNAHYPSVLVLQACEGAMQSSSQVFASVANRIVNQNIPVVVAMQYEVSNATACTFALEIYQRLGNGDSVDIAVQKARRQVVLSTNYKQRDFATPVLFMNVQNGYLFERANFSHEPAKIDPVIISTPVVNREVDIMQPKSKINQSIKQDDQPNIAEINNVVEGYEINLSNIFTINQSEGSVNKPPEVPVAYKREIFTSNKTVDDKAQVNINDRHQIFHFETVRVNNQGYITERIPGQAQYFREILPSGIELDMIHIPGGSFDMGSTEYSNEKPIHKVNIQPFYISKYLITQAQYKAVMGTNPSEFQGEKRPVENIRWDDAIKFCARLLEITGKQYKLPSEAQWEYAGRAGTTTRYYFGETITTELANYRSKGLLASLLLGKDSKGKYSKKLYRGETTNVGIFPPNSFGLYDIHGNVWEWCQDDWHDNYQDAPTDGSPWINSNGNLKVLRGGSWDLNSFSCRVTNRSDFNRANLYFKIGFRVSAENP